MNRKIFIGGISYDTTEQSLLEELKKYGQVVSIRIVTHRDTGKSKGFAFASFKDPESAVKAIEALDNTIFEGRRIGVKESLEKSRD